MSEEQKTIYVVTSGEYSDYGINALFDDRAAAEAFIARFLPHPADDGRIQEWIVNEHTGPMRRGETPWLAHFDPRGTLIAILRACSSSRAQPVQ